jgi:hypothetical protein
MHGPVSSHGRKRLAGRAHKPARKRGRTRLPEQSGWTARPRSGGGRSPPRGSPPRPQTTESARALPVGQMRRRSC